MQKIPGHGQLGFVAWNGAEAEEDAMDKLKGWGRGYTHMNWLSQGWSWADPTRVRMYLRVGAKDVRC